MMEYLIVIVFFIWLMYAVGAEMSAPKIKERARNKAKLREIDEFISKKGGVIHALVALQTELFELKRKMEESINNNDQNLTDSFLEKRLPASEMFIDIVRKEMPDSSSVWARVLTSTLPFRDKY